MVAPINRSYNLLKEAVGWGLIAVTPFNLLVIAVLDYLPLPKEGLFAMQIVYYFSVAAAFSVVGIMFVIEEKGYASQERQRRQIKRPEGIVCSVCGAVMRPGETKCGICGSSPLKECPRCRTLMSLNSEHCPKCGYSTV